MDAGLIIVACCEATLHGSMRNCTTSGGASLQHYHCNADLHAARGISGSHATRQQTRHELHTVVQAEGQKLMGTHHNACELGIHHDVLGLHGRLRTGAPAATTTRSSAATTATASAALAVAGCAADLSPWRRVGTGCGLWCVHGLRHIDIRRCHPQAKLPCMLASSLEAELPCGLGPRVPAPRVLTGVACRPRISMRSVTQHPHTLRLTRSIPDERRPASCTGRSARLQTCNGCVSCSTPCMHHASATALDMRTHLRQAANHLLRHVVFCCAGSQEAPIYTSFCHHPIQITAGPPNQ
jgi:hypothetical protein